LYCITNPEKLVFYGDFNGDVGAGIYLSFEECDSQTSDNCFSKKDKKEFFNQKNNFIVTIQNSEELVVDEYDA
jgi:hypothetical protein